MFRDLDPNQYTATDPDKTYSGNPDGIQIRKLVEENGAVVFRCGRSPSGCTLVKGEECSAVVVPISQPPSRQLAGVICFESPRGQNILQGSPA